ncbi:MAG: hypothetical protein HY327_06105 [Chloroflexi bacterium]|nr:hypothetical protein [Chloroflexota bacterium]
MNTQEKNVQQETNDEQIKPVTKPHHLPGIAVQTGIKAGEEKKSGATGGTTRKAKRHR